MSDTILVHRDGDIATLILNRPAKLNALTRPMWKRLGEAVSELSADDSVRCIVVRGAGEKAFAPGNDISEFENERASVEQARSYGETHHEALDALYRCRHPMIAMIHGICVGGGFEIAGLCDLRICGKSSRFGVPINRLGLTLGPREMKILHSLVGKAVTMEILLEGRVFGAEEALAKGLVNRVVDDDQVERDAYASARRVADGAPLVARWHKDFMRRLERPEPLQAQDEESAYACYGTEDFRIGYQSFLAKQTPKFRGE